MHRALLFHVIVGMYLHANLLAVHATESVFFVSTSGNDSWSGKRSEPDAARSDGPFATLGRAREAVRQQKGKHPAAGITVVVRGGIYPITRSLVLDSTDAGEEESPVVWQGAPGEDVRLTGSRSVRGFRPVTQKEFADRLAPAYRRHILVTDLKAQGITEYGVFPDRMNLYFRGKRMTVARYPNAGWLTIAGVPQSGGQILNPGDVKVIKDGHPAGKHCGRFTYDSDRPSTWARRSDMWMHGYWVWDWRDGYQRIDRIDSSAHLIYPAEPHHHYGYEKGQRYYYLNILEELDSPGEWCLDETEGLLYFWPPEQLHEGDVSVSMLKEPMVFLNNTSHVQIRHMTFEGSRASAVKILGGSDNLVLGCLIRNIDNDVGVIVDGGTRNGIRSCDVYDVGSTGIRLSGGDRKTLTPAGNFAVNNHIYRYGGIVQAFSGAIWMSGVGNTVAHNRIHDAPFSGIQFYGNDHVIEFNDIYDLAHESGDVGGVNTGADYSEQGTQIRFNYIHDTHGYGEGGFRAVYLDLPGSNTTITGNIFHNVDIGIFFNSGRDNLVQNNIFIHCHPSVNIYIWPHKAYFHEGGAWKIVEKLKDIRYKDPPYSVRYPRLPMYLDSADLGLPYGHRVLNNVSWAGTWLDLSEQLELKDVMVANNYIADSMLLVVTKQWTPDYDPYHIGYAAVHSNGDTVVIRELRERGNVIMQRAPAFARLKNGVVQLNDNADVYRLGFKRIPAEQIGLFVDEWRKTL